ncbi:MAG: hypothetical protein A3K19_15230 [Lentisphaerae bacterium RIFOXYB12_FULL_65_16]|nr:MAG: hypothetical protein A3K18_06930 [Lentisphaerae bacterium RIFOXYA12_64_32]OGV88444.1 MAG: hypothetical protein A3K19_15230 [Lentisphaerae bacterium RIFOXYB12_FULL_65_16]
MKTHRFSWDGVSFEVPGAWNLALHAFENRETQVALEDDYAVRLEAQWTRLEKRPDLETVRTRYSRAAEALGKAATATQPLDGLPEGWAGFLYSMPEDRQLAVAFVGSRVPPGFALFKLHFAPGDKETPREVLRALTSSLVFHNGDTVPWEAYDMSLEVPAEFKLVSTVLQAGQKCLGFQWRFRRLLVWQTSLADLVLKRQTKEQWAAGLLNRQEFLRGPQFTPGPDGSLLARRRRWNPLPHVEEIGRWCFRYHARCAHDPVGNKLFVWVWHHRRPADLAQLRGRVGPFPFRSEGA